MNRKHLILVTGLLSPLAIVKDSAREEIMSRDTLYSQPGPGAFGIFELHLLQILSEMMRNKIIFLSLVPTFRVPTFS